MKNIAILTPTRARPGRLDTFVNSVYQTAANPERVFCYNYIDEDDPRHKRIWIMMYCSMITLQTY
jgi:hypothetical protein